MKVIIKKRGFSESVGLGFSSVSASHRKNCTTGNHPIEKASLKDGLPFYFKWGWFLNRSPRPYQMLPGWGCWSRRIMATSPNNTDFSGNEKIYRGTGNGWNRVGNRFYRLGKWGHKKGTRSFLQIPYPIVAGATRRELATFPLDYPTIYLPVEVCLISTGEPILYHEEGNPNLVLL